MFVEWIEVELGVDGFDYGGFVELGYGGFGVGEFFGVFCFFVIGGCVVGGVCFGVDFFVVVIVCVLMEDVLEFGLCE